MAYCKFYDDGRDECIFDKGSSNGRPCKDSDIECQIRESYLKHSPKLAEGILNKRLQVQRFRRNLI